MEQLPILIKCLTQLGHKIAVVTDKKREFDYFVSKNNHLKPFLIWVRKSEDLEGLQLLTYINLYGSNNVPEHVKQLLLTRIR